MIVFSRGDKSKELETPVIEKRFAYTFLQRIISYVDQAHQYMMDFGKIEFFIYVWCMIDFTNAESCSISEYKHEFVEIL